MPLYFGRSAAITVLADPDPDVPMSPARRVGEHLALGGGRSIDVIGVGRLDLTLRWTRLPPAEVAVIEEFTSGAAGPGPFWFLPVDAPGWNFMPTLLASATSITGDTSGWATGAPHTLTSVTTPVLRGPRALRWQLAANTTAVRFLYPDGIAVPFALPIGGTGTWTWTYDARTITGTATMFAALEGAATLIGPDTTITTSWTTVSVTFAPPPGADVRTLIAVRPGPAIDVVIDTPRLTYGPQPRPWTPGRGVPQMIITDFDLSARWIDAYDLTLTLREIG